MTKIIFVVYNFKFADSWMYLFLSVAVAFWSFVQIFLHCEFGERLIERFNEIDDEMIQCDWYTFPFNIQKMWPFVIKGVQRPIILIGYGNVTCTREAFQNVCIVFMNFIG